MTSYMILEALLLHKFGEDLKENPELAKEYDVKKMKERFDVLTADFLCDYAIDNGVTA